MTGQHERKDDMKFIPLFLAALALLLTTPLAQADDRKVVEAFYTELLSAPCVPYSRRRV